MAQPFIPIILGTAREGRNSEKVARAVQHILSQRDDMTVQFVDVKDHIHGRTIPPWEEHEATQDWKEIVKKADGFLIVTPEYNHGYPGELKMLLDQELKQYPDKPVVVCSVSKGGFGGIRVIENLLPVFRELGMIASSYSVSVSKVGDFPDDPEAVEDSFKEKVKKAGDTLLKMMRT